MAVGRQAKNPCRQGIHIKTSAKPFSQGSPERIGHRLGKSAARKAIEYKLQIKFFPKPQNSGAGCEKMIKPVPVRLLTEGKFLGIRAWCKIAFTNRCLSAELTMQSARRNGSTN